MNNTFFFQIRNLFFLKDLLPKISSINWNKKTFTLNQDGYCWNQLNQIKSEAVRNGAGRQILFGTEFAVLDGQRWICDVGSRHIQDRSRMIDLSIFIRDVNSHATMPEIVANFRATREKRSYDKKINCFFCFTCSLIEISRHTGTKYVK